MNVNDGELRDFNVKDLASLGGEWLPVEKKRHDREAKKNNKVSLKDHRSTLGKKLTYERKLVVNMSQPCPCGSGTKFKNCCRNNPKSKQP